jgi:hypothetical protein
LFSVLLTELLLSQSLDQMTHRHSDLESSASLSAGLSLGLYLCFFFFFFLVGLEFQFSASCLQSRCSTTWAASPVYFALVILQMGGLMNYFPGLASNRDPPNFSLPRSWDYRCGHWYLASGLYLILPLCPFRPCPISSPFQVVTHEPVTKEVLCLVGSQVVQTAPASLLQILITLKSSGLNMKLERSYLSLLEMIFI